MPVALVNGVYFPGQRLRFKVNDPQKQAYNMRDGYYGIVGKRFPSDLNKSDEKKQDLPSNNQ